MESRKCLYCDGPMNLPRADAIFCSQRCGVYYRRRRTLPVALTSRARWVRHDRQGRPLTIDSRMAAVDNPSTWAPFADARASNVGDGMGFVLTGDGIGCIDLDHCIVDGSVEPWAQEFIDANPNTFTETSRSGTGIHLWGQLPSAPGRKIRDGRNIEIYSRGRYIALGTPLAGTSLKLEPLIIP